MYRDDVFVQAIYSSVTKIRVYSTNLDIHGISFISYYNSYDVVHADM